MFCGAFRSRNNLICQKNIFGKGMKQFQNQILSEGDGKQYREKNLTTREIWRNPEDSGDTGRVIYYYYYFIIFNLFWVDFQ